MTVRLTIAERIIQRGQGFSRIHTTKPLLTPPEGNHKINKNERPTWSLALAPDRSLTNMAEVRMHLTTMSNLTLCPASTAECRKACLTTAGRNQASNASNARDWRTQLLLTAPGVFRDKLYAELAKVQREDGAARLNALSDLAWERIWPDMFDEFPRIQFYDYTKRWQRIELPPNYDLTYSVQYWRNFSVEYANPSMRFAGVVSEGHHYWERDAMFGRKFIDGDLHDYRPDDPVRSLVLLRPKGAARNLKRGGFIL